MNEKELIKNENESLAMSLIKLLKVQNKRMFIAWLITFIGLVLSICYIVYLLNDVTTIDTDTIDINEVSSINESTIENN